MGVGLRFPWELQTQLDSTGLNLEFRKAVQAIMTHANKSSLQQCLFNN